MHHLFFAVLLVALSFFGSGNARAEQTSEFGQGLLSTAKIAGACGILDSLIHFQNTTKMNGGDEFVSRFWSLEATRLGISVEELSTRCNQALAAYDTYWNMLENNAQ